VVVAEPEAGSPAVEIEITPEMIEAGFKILSAAAISDDLPEEDRLTVVEIYRAI